MCIARLFDGIDNFCKQLKVSESWLIVFHNDFYRQFARLYRLVHQLLVRLFLDHRHENP